MRMLQIMCFNAQSYSYSLDMHVINTQKEKGKVEWF
jgi:hypothetical protein